MNHTLAFVFFFGFSLISADVKSTTGTLNFDSNNDGTPELTLQTEGLGIGKTPSANLDVLGNAIIRESLTIGSHTASSNLDVAGTVGIQPQSISSSMDLLNDSYYLADSSSDNLSLFLPHASSVEGRIITIKKTSNTNNVVVTSNDAAGIDGQAAILLSSGTEHYPVLQTIAGNTGWYILNMSGNRAASDNTIYENLEDGSFTEQMTEVSSVAISVTAGIGIDGSFGVDHNNDGALSVGSGNVNIPSRSTFSVMGKFQVYSSFTTNGAMTVGWDTSGDNSYNSYVGPGSSYMVRADLALSGSANTYSLYAYHSHGSMQSSGTSLTGDSATFTDDNWYKLRGTVDFDGTDTFTWNLAIDEYDSNGTVLLTPNLLTGSGSYTSNIGTMGRFVFLTNRDRGFEVTDQHFYTPE